MSGVNNPRLVAGAVAALAGLFAVPMWFAINFPVGFLRQKVVEVVVWIATGAVVPGINLVMLVDHWTRVGDGLGAYLVGIGVAINSVAWFGIGYFVSRRGLSLTRRAFLLTGFGALGMAIAAVVASR